MGLFSTIGGIAGAAIGGYFGGGEGAKAGASIGSSTGGFIDAKKASKKNKKAIRAAEAEQLAANERARAALLAARDDALGDFDPWISGGQKGLGGILDLLGLNGADAQGGAIAGLEESPLFQALLRQGQEGYLQAGSATGDLRGGNLRDVMADFRGDTLAEAIQQQLANLGALSGSGLNAAGMSGQIGYGYNNSIADLINRVGGIKGGSILAQRGIGNSLANQQALLGGTIVGSFGAGGQGGQQPQQSGQPSFGVPGFAGGMFGGGGDTSGGFGGLTSIFGNMFGGGSSASGGGLQSGDIDSLIGSNPGVF